MYFDFAALLVLLSVVTGLVWLLDILVLAPRRQKAVVTGGAQGQAGAAPRSRPQVPWYVDYSRSFFPVIVAVLVLRSFIIEPFRIPSGSMMPTLLDGDFILVNKFAFGVRLPVLNTKIIDSGAPQRGDVAVFRYPQDPSLAYIKRVVGLPGDRIAYDYRGKQLIVNGEPVPRQLSRSSVAPPNTRVFLEQLGAHNHLIQVAPGPVRTRYPELPHNAEITVPAGHYFVMGDNRDNSQDSRYWGWMPEENLIGKAFFIWMNLDCITFNGHCGRIGGSIE